MRAEAFPLQQDEDLVDVLQGRRRNHIPLQKGCEIVSGPGYKHRTPTG
jgi:hypothetical protein